MPERIEASPRVFMPRGTEARKGQWTIGRVIRLSEEDVATLYIPHACPTKKGQQQQGLPPGSSVNIGTEGRKIYQTVFQKTI